MNYHKVQKYFNILMIKEILRYVEKHDLSGDHFIVLVIDTKNPDLVFPEHIKARYPKEIKIVLQNCFRDLKVEDLYFSVEIRFSGIPSIVTIPFESIISFGDPHADFSLNLSPDDYVDHTIDKEIKDLLNSIAGSPSKTKIVADLLESKYQEELEEKKTKTDIEEKIVFMDDFKNKK